LKINLSVVDIVKVVEKYLSGFLFVYLIFVCNCSCEPNSGSSSGLGSGCSCWGWGVRDASVVGQGDLPQAPLVPSAVLGENVGHVRSRTTCTLLLIHDLWVPKYVKWCYVIVCTFIYPFVVTNKLPYFFRLCAAGLLPAARLVQGDSQRDAIPLKDRMTRFQYDFSLLSTLMDHFRPQTHTFHFTVDEMTVTLQDMSLLMGLTCEGEPLGPADISTECICSSSLSSRTFLGTIAPPPRTRSLRTFMDPPWLGCSSLAYIPLKVHLGS
jgi:hypothetical protein